MATVLIAGCGYVGCEFAKLLIAHGHKVYAIRRHTQFLPTGTFPLALDLTIFTASELPQAIDYVFYLAAAEESSELAYHKAYYLGLKNLLINLQQTNQRPKRIFFSSSTAVYAQNQGEWVNEQSVTLPQDFKGKILLAAEQLLLQSGFAGVIIRYAGIYGPGRTYLIQQVASGRAALSKEDIYTNRIHLQDCVGILWHLMQMKQPESIYLAADNMPALKNEVLCWLAAQLKVEIKHQAIANAQEHELRSNKRCSNQRLRASGYQFLYPSYQDGYSALLPSYNQSF